MGLINERFCIRYRPLKKLLIGGRRKKNKKVFPNIQKVLNAFLNTINKIKQTRQLCNHNLKYFYLLNIAHNKLTTVSF